MWVANGVLSKHNLNWPISHNVWIVSNFFPQKYTQTRTEICTDIQRITVDNILFTLGNFVSIWHSLYPHIIPTMCFKTWAKIKFWVDFVHKHKHVATKLWLAVKPRQMPLRNHENRPLCCKFKGQLALIFNLLLFQCIRKPLASMWAPVLDSNISL